jgi:hypothetical protein
MRFQLPLALLLTVPTTIACTNDAASPADDDLDTVTESLELENGGFDTADESPQFGDEALYAAADLETDVAVSDPMAIDPSIAALEANASVVAHNVVVMWGRMPADLDGTPRNWSGELRLSRGAMVIRRQIAFEPATDRIIARTRPGAIQFESRTSVHADGFALTVLDPNPADPTPLALTYVSADGAITYTLALGALADGPAIADAGDGNQIVAIGHRRNDTCDQGFLRGRWRALAPNAGHYAGLILDSDGQPTGHLRGLYGKRRDGQAVFFGKLIGRDGSFRGLIGGTYEEGHFGGRWLVRSGDHGVVRGMYRPGDTLRGGRFLARWAETSCAGR